MLKGRVERYLSGSVKRHENSIQIERAHRGGRKSDSVVGVTVNEAVGVPRPTTIMPAPLFTAEIPAFASTSVLKAPVPSVTSIPAAGEGLEVVLVIGTPELIACPGMGKPDILITIANAEFREKASSALR